MLDKEKEQVGNQAAPAVVGTLQVSDEILDFSSLSVKKSCKKSECAKKADDNLTPRERAILERLKAKEK
ncbi:hypothetical protein [Mycoplasmopsis opalescens]|uniref:hypothetical protein n=1 Tax=Mycoplasmopsis opalescens TaxID=114886 RepID=UPI00055D09C1|nr:hypothetical protein [Mycoplasmopsis opalescens]